MSSTYLHKLVSIIIPTYNREKIVQETIKNIQSQTYKNWECIIVDDHSTDGTKSVIEELAKQDNRIRYILNQRSKGAQGARNTGILEATAEWIAFNDSDDEWVPDKLEKQFKIIEQKDFHPFLVVHGNCLVSDHANNKITKWDLPLVEGKQPYELLLKSASPLFPTIITSRKALETIGLLDEKVPAYQEWDTSIQLSEKCEFVHIEEPLFIYHLHKGDTMSKDIKRDIAGYQYIRLKHAKEFIKHFGNDAFYASVVDNIKRSADKEHWALGFQLLKEAKAFMPANKYWFLRSCFKLHIHPEKDLDPLHQLRKKIRFQKT
jgi:glycosyltransferase involved in cell wall biosynthesis